MDPAIVELLITGIRLAREVITVYVSRVDGDPHIERTERGITVIRERVLDRASLERIINHTNDHFARLLDAHAVRIIKHIEQQTRETVGEMREQRIREGVQEVQARVSALKTLLTIKSLDDNIAIQLVISALNPLQVSLGIAKFRLQDYGDEETWQYCYLIGTGALVSGYAFLNRDVSELVESLEKSMYQVQKRILNQVAARLLASDTEIPWEQVPKLLMPEGAEDLLALHSSCMDTPIHANDDSAADVNTLTVSEVRSVVVTIMDAKKLKQMRTAERNGKGRPGAIQAIDRQLKALQVAQS